MSKAGTCDQCGGPLPFDGGACTSCAQRQDRAKATRGADIVRLSSRVPRPGDGVTCRLPGTRTPSARGTRKASAPELPRQAPQAGVGPAGVSESTTPPEADSGSNAARNPLPSRPAPVAVSRYRVIGAEHAFPEPAESAPSSSRPPAPITSRPPNPLALPEVVPIADHEAAPTPRAEPPPGAATTGVRPLRSTSGSASADDYTASPWRTHSAERAGLSATTSHADGTVRNTSTHPRYKRPPVLASESLLEDIAPVEPARVSMRALAVVLGAAGAFACVAFSALSGLGVWTALAFALLVVLGCVPLRYSARAAGVCAISIVTMMTSLWQRQLQSSSKADPVLALAVVVLGSALLFRASYRASRLARFLVGAGVALGWTWLALSGGLSVLVLSNEWQSWAPVAVRAVFAVLLLLSLLAFMGSATTGGCRVWAAALLGWYPACLGVDLALRFFEPGHGQTPAPFHVAMTVTVAVSAVLCATGLWQLLADAAVGRRQRWNPMRRD